MKKLLLIDDDKKLAGPLKAFLAQFDFDLDSEIEPLRALEYLPERDYALIIIDVMLPGIDGFETCRRIRQFSSIPVIMLTARGDVLDRVVGLEIGADDYLPKPFEPRELVARIQNILRRTASGMAKPGQLASHLEFPGLRIDTGKQQVLTEQGEIELTGNEYRLLHLLASEPDKIFSRDDIMNQLNGIDADVYSRAIDVLISRLRNKLKPLDVIKTVRARGYRFAGC